jgi:hypothetical protein
MTKYNKELLEECLKRDNGTLIGNYEKLNRNSCIRFKCSCGEEGEKTLRRAFLNGGLYCKLCCIQNKVKKMSNTNIITKGVEYQFQDPIVKKKIIDTNIKKYNCIYPLQNKEIYEKVKNTNMIKRGVEYPGKCEEVKLKIKNTNLIKYNVENPFQSESIKQKIYQTTINKYGVKYAMQNPDISFKSLNNSLKIKEYTLPSGNKIKVQGYEPMALDILINEWKIEENDIITERTKVPEIWWKDKEDKSHRYYPDIFITSKNLIIEVKSTWTYEKHKSNTKYKLLASKELGYSTLLWIFDNKKYLEEYKDCCFEEE